MNCTGPYSGHALAPAQEGVGIGEMGGAHWFAGETPDPSTLPPAVQLVLAQTQADKTGPSNPEGEIAIRAVYDIHPNGRVDIRWSMDTCKALPARLAPGLLPSLPRVGVRTATHGSLGHVRWHGRGPQECYWDRKHGALLGQYGSAVPDLRVPYVFPQESGGRADVRWVTLLPREVADSSSGSATGGGVGLAAVAQSAAAPLHVSVSEYSMEAVHAARHEYDLVRHPDGRTFVHLDHVHMGVGGDDSWSPSVHAEFLVPPAVYEWGMALLPVGSAEEAERAFSAGPAV